MKKVLVSLVLLLIVFGFITARQVKGEIKPAADESSLLQQTISTCKNRVNVPESEMHWLYVPESADLLHTNLSLAFLAGQLISNGAVDASSCPAGGLGVNGYANACGLSKTNAQVLEIQNAFDEAILQAWKDTGVPPVLLKQMIRYESQFWPGRWGTQHYGLGHMTYYGAQTALYWRSDLYKQVCDATSGTCSGAITNQDITKFLNLMDAYCPTCPNKIDMAKATKSIALLAEAVYGTCEQTARIIYNATNVTSGYVVDYATIWKLTLMNYNAGPNCVFSAVGAAYNYTQTRVSWYDIGYFTSGAACRRGLTYANQITEQFYAFPPK